ncbi:MAG: Na(+)-translocating NADH-quinone reductase subunit A [Gemmatimonadota bacterium]|nr:Na(+)-translocating NADH-quinone reductase subunit A [Gemmatimonadota bacterium]
MGLHEIRKGLDLPIDGAPVQSVTDGPTIGRVAFLADDFPGIKPRVSVEEGQRVRRGDVVCEDRAVPGVRHTAPGAGEVVAIHRGERRALQSIVIELSDGERRDAPGEEELAALPTVREGGAEGSTDLEVRSALLESGLWTALRTRPFGKVPSPDSKPSAIFVTATDTNPLSAEPEILIEARRADFDLGLRLIARLTDGETYLCVRAGSDLTRGVDAPVSVQEFAGPHPAGLAGVHIHLLAPVSRTRSVWTIGYQEVTSIGSLFRTGRLDVSRVVALGGPPVPRPRLVRTRVGASLADLLDGEGLPEDVRWISGSVLSGKAAMGEVFGFLGRHDYQVSILQEGRRRELLSWLSPGKGTFSALPVYLPRFSRRAKLDFTTSTHGGDRAMVPIGLYERVMPMDILPTFLLRALVVGDIEQAEKLGCLELVEEDLGLLSFVDPGKTDYGPLLRDALARLEEEG